MDAFGHLKAIGHTPEAKPLLGQGRRRARRGVTDLGDGFIAAAGKRFFDREAKVRTLAWGRAGVLRYFRASTLRLIGAPWNSSALASLNRPNSGTRWMTRKPAACRNPSRNSKVRPT